MAQCFVKPQVSLQQNKAGQPVEQVFRELLYSNTSLSSPSVSVSVITREAPCDTLQR